MRRHFAILRNLRDTLGGIIIFLWLRAGIPCLVHINQVHRVLPTAIHAIRGKIIKQDMRLNLIEYRPPATRHMSHPLLTFTITSRDRFRRLCRVQALRGAPQTGSGDRLVRARCPTMTNTIKHRRRIPTGIDSGAMAGAAGISLTDALNRRTSRDGSHRSPRFRIPSSTVLVSYESSIFRERRVCRFQINPPIFGSIGMHAMLRRDFETM